MTLSDHFLDGHSNHKDYEGHGKTENELSGSWKEQCMLVSLSWKGEGCPQPAARAAAGTRGKQTGRTRNSQWKGCAEGRGALKREREREKERESI